MDLMNQNINHLQMTPPSSNPEEDFKDPTTGAVDTLAAQAKLQELQKKGAELTVDEVRYCISLIRILRRTNTGPAASRKGAAAKKKANVDPDADVLDI